MAKKQKQAESKPGSPAWMATFSDLMNLLLCFFVLLFSMSSVNEEKWEQVVASMTSSFSIFSGGGVSIGDGMLISTGTSQLSNLDEYYSSMGQTSEDTEGEEIKDKNVEELIDEENRKETQEMYDNVSEMVEDSNLDDYVSVGMDKNGKYIEFILQGTFLFDSAKAELKNDSLPVLSKLGDILMVYDDNLIEIIGHTDNIPMNSPKYESNDILSSARAISAKDYFVNIKGLDVTSMKWSGKGEYEPIASNATEEGRQRNRRIEIRIYNSLNSN